MVSAIDPPPDHAGGLTRRKALTLDQDAGGFCWTEQQIVGPFQPKLRLRPDHPPNRGRKCDSRYVRKLGEKAGLRRGVKKQTAIKIAGRRGPATPEPTPARDLDVGAEPDRIALARSRQGQRILVRRARLLNVNAAGVLQLRIVVGRHASEQ